MFQDPCNLNEVPSLRLPTPRYLSLLVNQLLGTIGIWPWVLLGFRQREQYDAFSHVGQTRKEHQTPGLGTRKLQIIGRAWWSETCEPSKSTMVLFAHDMRVCVCVLSHFSCVRLFVTLWIIGHQSSLSKGFSGQEYWSGLLCPPPGDLPDPGIKLVSLMSPPLAGRLFTTSATWEAPCTWHACS